LASLAGLTKLYLGGNSIPPYIDDKSCYIDGIFGIVLKTKVKGRIWKIKAITYRGSKVCYLVSDGNGNYSHGDTYSQAKRDLFYKQNAGKNSSDYSHLRLESELPVDEMAVCYHAITGACFFGIKAFIEDKGLNGAVSVQEIIGLTKGHYGHEKFEGFFMPSAI
jgi:hypothetical protein